MDLPADPDGLRALPSVDRVLRAPELAEVRARFAREPLVRIIRRTLEACRQEIAVGATPPSLSDITAHVMQAIGRDWAVSPVRVINATGVVLHTNLGRAPLSARAMKAVTEAAAYTDLELNLESGARETRQTSVARVLCDLTGAEAAFVVCNNAAAVTLALAALARSREVIVSRGQAVEIGGGFRVPSILRQSGARLVEVGTTNRTRLEDYEEAITLRTAAILHVHSSNFRMTGFTEHTELSELAPLAHARGLLLISDNGSGSLIDTTRYGLAHEPMPSEALAASADVVCFSGDKLLGGPQSGIILGTQMAVQRLAKYPLARAVRPDKLGLAALSGTLNSYTRGALDELPVWQMIGLQLADLTERVGRWTAEAARRGVDVEVQAGESTIGGGSLPGESLPTLLIVLPRGITAAALRRSLPPIVARAQGGRILLDLRTVAPGDDASLLDAVVGVAQSA